VGEKVQSEETEIAPGQSKRQHSDFKHQSCWGFLRDPAMREKLTPREISLDGAPGGRVGRESLGSPRCSAPPSCQTGDRIVLGVPMRAGAQGAEERARFR
jgi:hypothetical protein